MFIKGTVERQAFERGYLDGYVSRAENNPYENKVLANAWILGYNSGKADKHIIENARV